MNVLIADSNADDLFRLRSMLARCPEVRSVALADNLASARKILKNGAVDVAFFDVGLGDSARFLSNATKRPHVVLMGGTASHEPCPVDPAATDCMVKPLCELILLRILLRVACDRGDPVAAESAAPQRERPQCHRLVLSSIVAVKARGNYADVWCGSKQLLDRRSLRQWEQQLASRGFTRLDRSTLLRLDRVKSWIPVAKGAQVGFINTPVKIKIGNVALQRLEALVPPPHLAPSRVMEVVCQEPARHWQAVLKIPPMIRLD